MASEGHCPKCGEELGIAGHCYACELTMPRCKQCGATLIHSRLHGYYCPANREHKGVQRGILDKETKIDGTN